MYGRKDALNIANKFAKSGKELWQLYKDICKGDMGQTIRILERIQTQDISAPEVRAALDTGDAQNILKGRGATTNELRTHHKGQLTNEGMASSRSKHQRHWLLRHLTQGKMKVILRRVAGLGKS